MSAPQIVTGVLTIRNEGHRCIMEFFNEDRTVRVYGSGPALPDLTGIIRVQAATGLRTSGIYKYGGNLFSFDTKIVFTPVTPGALGAGMETLAQYPYTLGGGNLSGRADVVVDRD